MWGRPFLRQRQGPAACSLAELRAVGRALARDPNSCAAALQGRGGSTGYDNAVALPGRSDDEELAKENNKSTKALKGQIVFSVAKVAPLLSFFKLV